MIANILKLFLHAEHAQLQRIKFLKLPCEVAVIFISHVRKVGLWKGQWFDGDYAVGRRHEAVMLIVLYHSHDL